MRGECWRGRGWGCEAKIEGRSVASEKWDGDGREGRGERGAPSYKYSQEGVEYPRMYDEVAR